MRKKIKKTKFTFCHLNILPLAYSKGLYIILKVNIYKTYYMMLFSSQTF